jgi:hypothetical protein
MSRADERLLDRSLRYLLEARYALNPSPGADPDEAYGRILLDQIDQALKVAIDTEDKESFTQLETGWQEIPEETDAWLPSNDSPSGRLISHRRVLSFGLAMWVLHLVRSDTDPISEFRSVALRALSQRFSDVEDVLDIYDAATEHDEGERTPWTNWFLQELPEGEAHMIPTSSELLVTALLLAVAWTRPQQAEELRPRDWFDWRAEEIEQTLDRLGDESERWAPVLGSSTSENAAIPVADAQVEDWRARIDRLREQLDAGRKGWKEKERQAVRADEIDPAKERELVQGLLAFAKKRRVIRQVMKVQGAMKDLPAKPEEHEELAARSWVPKRMLVADHTVLGIDMAGRDLARPSLDAEAKQLLDALSGAQPTASDGDEDSFISALTDAIAEMTDSDLPPTLLLLPISWRLRQALGMAPVWGTPDMAGNDLVPAIAADQFAGTFLDVPALDIPQVPADLAWLISLPAAATFIEWPSQENSGIRVEVEEYTAESAATFLDQHPDVAGELSREEAINFLQENVMISRFLAWKIEAGKSEAARSLKLPESLIFSN